MRRVQSMTGYGRATVALGDGGFRVELRSVNARYLDARINLPFTDSEMHTELLRALRKRLERGRVELTVIADSMGAQGRVRADVPLASAYREALEEIRAALGLVAPVSLELIASQRGVLEAAAPDDPSQLRMALERGVAEALDALEDARAEEGSALVADLRLRVQALRGAVGRLAAAAKADPDAQKQRLQARIDELLGSSSRVDPPRIAAEVALLALRSDVHEEVVRIQGHLDRVEALLKGAGPIGRKLDFLCQEIGREVNTSAAKVADPSAVDEILVMKAEVDRMREQVQNLE